jgi:hypothetical protein
VKLNLPSHALSEVNLQTGIRSFKFGGRAGQLGGLLFSAGAPRFLVRFQPCVFWLLLHEN